MIYFLLIINFICFVVFGIDKRKAQKHQRRISENTLLLLTFFGGIVGAISGMLAFRHKLSKKSFLLKLIVVISVELILMYLLVLY